MNMCWKVLLRVSWGAELGSETTSSRKSEAARRLRQEGQSVFDPKCSYVHSRFRNVGKTELVYQK